MCEEAARLPRPEAGEPLKSPSMAEFANRYVMVGEGETRTPHLKAHDHKSCSFANSDTSPVAIAKVDEHLWCVHNSAGRRADNGYMTLPNTSRMACWGAAPMLPCRRYA